MVRFECKICLREYKTNILNLTPRILTACGHTACQGCLETLMNQNPTGDVMCPFDRITSNINGDVEELHKNFAILECMEEIGQGNLPPAEQAPPANIENDNPGEQGILHQAVNREEYLDPMVPDQFMLENIGWDDFLALFEPLPPFLLQGDFDEGDDGSDFWDSDDDEEQLFADMINDMDNFNIGDYEDNYENFNDEYV